MSGSAIQAMNSSLSANKKLLRSKRLFKREKTFFQRKSEYLDAAGGTLAFKKASNEDLVKIRKKIRKQRKKENMIFFAIVISVFSLLSYGVLKLVQNNTFGVDHRKEFLEKQRGEAYLDLIGRGDNYFKKAEWHNAIFIYKEAKLLFPNHYDINYRIVNAYSFQCEYEFENCQTAKKLLDALYKKFPDKASELLVIKERLKYEY